MVGILGADQSSSGGGLSDPVAIRNQDVEVSGVGIEIFLSPFFGLLQLTFHKRYHAFVKAKMIIKE